MAKDLNDFFDEIDNRINALEDNPFVKTTPEKIAGLRNKNLRKRSQILGKKIFSVVPEEEVAQKAAPKAAKKAGKGIFSGKNIKKFAKGAGLVGTGAALASLLSDDAEAGVESRAVDDIVESLPFVGDLFGRLEGDPSDPSEKKRRAIEDQGSPEFTEREKAIGKLAAGGLITGGALAKRGGKKAIEGIIDDPVGKARGIKGAKSAPIDAEFRDITGGRDLTTTGSKTGRKAGRASKFSKLVGENAGFTDEIADEVIDKVVDSGTEKTAKKAAKETGAEAVEKATKKAFLKTKKGKFLMLLAGGLALNQLGDKKEKKKPSKVFDLSSKKPRESSLDARDVQNEFKKFQEELKQDLKSMEQ